jgi:hypothetical protein
VATYSATFLRWVDSRYLYMRSLYGNVEHVAPISAPMLQMVAIPVQEMELTPSPKYSMMAPVPPLTVKMSAN